MDWRLLPLDLIQQRQTPPSVLADAAAPAAPAEDADTFSIHHSIREPKIFKGGQAKSFSAVPTNPSSDYVHAVQKFEDALVPFMKKQTATYKYGMKVHCSVKARFDVIKEGELVDQPEPLFAAKSITLTPGEMGTPESKIKPMLETLQNGMVDYRDRGSGFVFNQVCEFKITLANYTPFRVGQYIATPLRIFKIKATLNIKQFTDDDKRYCFIDSINSIIHPALKNADQPKRYRSLRTIWNMGKLRFPLSVSDVSKFEKLNPILCINLYGVDLHARANGKPLFFPYKLSPNRDKPDRKIVNLLLLEKGSNYHFVAIKCLRRLTRSNNSKHRGGKRTDFACCPYCLNHMKSSKIESHQLTCSEFRPIATELPPAGSIMEFTRYDTTCPVDYYICGDFETREVLTRSVEPFPESKLAPDVVKPYEWIQFPSELKHVQQQKCRVCSPMKPCPKIEQSTKTCCRLETFSYAYKVVCASNPAKSFPLRIHQAPNVKKAFVAQLREDMYEIRQKLRVNVPIWWKPGEQERHDAIKHCQTCNALFSKENWKCADHDHGTGRYRRSLCNRCNLAWKAKNVAFLLHNNAAFDSHLILQAIAEDEDLYVKKIYNVVPKNVEEYIQFSVAFRCDHCVERLREERRLCHAPDDGDFSSNPRRSHASSPPPPRSNSIERIASGCVDVAAAAGPPGPPGRRRTAPGQGFDPAGPPAGRFDSSTPPAAEVDDDSLATASSPMPSTSTDAVAAAEATNLPRVRPLVEEEETEEEEEGEETEEEEEEVVREAAEEEFDVFEKIIEEGEMRRLGERVAAADADADANALVVDESCEDDPLCFCHDYQKVIFKVERERRRGWRRVAGWVCRHMLRQTDRQTDRHCASET